MEKSELLEKLQELGIETKNAHPKVSFFYKGDVHVGLYEREMKDDFYFVNKFDKRVYKWKHDKEKYEYDKDTEKFMIPIDKCQLLWEDKPFKELEDIPYKEMTLRQYACIHLRVADSGIGWLDVLIRHTSEL